MLIILGSSVGVEGGTYYFAIMLYFFKFTVKTSIGMSNAMLFVEAFVTFCFVATAKHPRIGGRYLVDYSLGFVLLVPIFIGSFVGTILAGIVPVLLQIVLILIVVLVTVVKVVLEILAYFKGNVPNANINGNFELQNNLNAPNAPRFENQLLLDGPNVGKPNIGHPDVDFNAHLDVTAKARLEFFK